jgi:hypothetical protein
MFADETKQVDLWFFKSETEQPRLIYRSLFRRSELVAVFFWFTFT